MLEISDKLHPQVACSASYMEVFLQVLEEKGINFFSWFENSAIDPQLLEKFNGYVSYKDLERFVNQVPQFMEVQGFGLAIGKKLDLSAHGTLAYAVMSSETYMEGFEVFRRFQKLRSQFIEFTLHRTSQDLTFDFTISEHMSDDLYRFYIECALAGTYTFLKSYLSAPQLKVQLGFDYPAPEYIHLYDETFANPIEFNQGKNTLSFDIALADRASTTANEKIFSMAQQQCLALMGELNSDSNLAEKIHSYLLHSPWNFPTQESIAKQFSMSIRTLRRRLNELGTDYQALLDSVRETLAKKYLHETAWSVNEIAQVLGYSEATNFKRAFKRWTGFTPTDFRNKKSG